MGDDGGHTAVSASQVSYEVSGESGVDPLRHTMGRTLGALGKNQTCDTRFRNPLEGFRGQGRIAGNRVVARVCGFSGFRRFAVFLVLSRTRYGQERDLNVVIVPICHNVEYY